MSLSLQFDHIGIPTDTPQPGEFWVAQRGWFVSRNQRNSVVWTKNSRTALKL